MRHGFKAWCESSAGRLRAELQLRQEEQLDPWDLADHLGVVVWFPEDVPGLNAKHLEQLTVNDKDSWSAMTIAFGESNLTIVNSSHALTRQRSSLCHELAHIILKHEPSRIDLSPAGHLLLSSFEREQEEEANWLSGTLLVPRNGLNKVFRSKKNPSVLANHFGVSEALLNWRLRMTGVATQAQRARKRSR